MLTAALLTTACTSQKEAEGPAEWETEKITVADSSEYAHVSVEAELPLAKDSAMTAMRNTLISLIAKDIRDTYNDNEDEIQQLHMPYKTFEGDTTDAKAVFAYNLSQLNKFYTAMTKAERVEYDKFRQEEAAADTTGQTDPDSVAVPDPSFRTYEQTCEFDTTHTTSKAAVFELYAYLNNSEAAHPYSSLGAGHVTLRRSDGKWINQFLVDGAEDKMQSLLLDGMVRFFSDACRDESINRKTVYSQLLLCDKDGNETKHIPLPQWPLLFDKDDGLIFMYKQYEVAPYAAGMPEFTIPLQDVMPYLTEDAKSLLAE